jgi:hypothetical protein
LGAVPNARTLILRADGVNARRVLDVEDFNRTAMFEEKYGKTHIVLETGHAPTIVGCDVLVKGIDNILVYLKMIDGRLERYAR